jgi:hypothetical protein
MLRSPEATIDDRLVFAAAFEDGHTRPKGVTPGSELVANLHADQSQCTRPGKRACKLVAM